MNRQPWLRSKLFDSMMILSPPFLAVIVTLIFRSSFDRSTEVPLWAWISFILCIDVAHVYSTLFRSYLNPVEFKENKILLMVIPLCAWLLGVLLYSIDALLFWRTLAYVAVFHFIRQQYGFMMLYSRDENANQRKFKWIDKALIYLATLYPILYWHTHLPRNFHWFVEGDFFTGIPLVLSDLCLVVYLCFLLAYVVKEAMEFKKARRISIPKQWVILGTALSWYVGIVLLNGDMAFTLTNVVSHGIPYIGLIWIYGKRQSEKEPEQSIWGAIQFKHVFAYAFFPVFIFILFAFAYLEEGLWAGFVWRDHLGFFTFFSALPKISDASTLAWLVPLLALPQSTHYILDGFIWRLKDRDANWQKLVLRTEASS